LLGGVLVPNVLPPGFWLEFQSGADGTILVAANWPHGLPSGLELYLQYWIVDASGPFGFTSSNAIRGTTP
jgi:hypothetical protein